jgi:hypothetical protein
MAVLLDARDRLVAQDPELVEDEARLADWLASDPTTCDAMDVLHQVLRLSIHCKDMADAADRRAREIMARRDRYNARLLLLREAACRAMEALGSKRIELPDLTASVRPGMPELILDQAQLPDECLRIKREPDKTRIRALLEDGANVPGAVLGNAAPVLTVRTR